LAAASLYHSGRKVVATTNPATVISKKMRVVRAKPHADWTIWWIITRVAKTQGCIIRIATRGDRADGGSSYRRKEAPCISLLDLF
jgi:hypothetical protein